MTWDDFERVLCWMVIESEFERQNHNATTVALFNQYLTRWVL